MPNYKTTFYLKNFDYVFFFFVWHHFCHLRMYVTLDVFTYRLNRD
uniref:Uncharacterized protein n=1 Tax=Ciona intestinalis TaxID=7719 RepID=H2XWP3_CIOIN